MANGIGQRRVQCPVVFALTCLAVTAVLTPVRATDVTLGPYYDYITGAVNYENTTSLAAGQLYAIELMLNDAATNATIGNWLGYCVALRSDGLSQCQYTVQFAEGTLQVCDSELLV